MGRKIKGKKFVKCFICGANMRKENLDFHIEKFHFEHAKKFREEKEKKLEAVRKLAEILKLAFEPKKLSEAIIDNADIFIEINGEKPDTWIAIGDAYFDIENFKKAKECYRKAMKIDPSLKELNDEIRVCNDIIKDLKRNDWKDDDLDELYEKAEEAEEMELYNLCLHLINEILKLDNENIDTIFWKGEILFDLGRYKEAKSVFLEALKRKPDGIEAKSNLGLIHIMLNEMEEAEECYNEFLEFYPSHVPVIHNLGVLYLSKKQYLKALEFFNKAINIDQKYYMAWYSKYQTLHILGRYKEAKKCLEKAEKLNLDYVTYRMLSELSNSNEIHIHKTDWGH